MTIDFGDLKMGERGRIMGFKPGDIGQRQKLLSMGLTPGTEFAVVRVAPLGDPVEIRVRDTSLSLRKDEMTALLIERIGAEPAVDRDDTLTIAIIGNPNCGKSTLFNGLTGAQQKVGNWAGVTVEKKEGFFRFAGQCFRVVDLPGIYSLDAYDETSAIDERIARDYILSGEADLIVNIVDTSHLEHNLYLTTQLLEMRAPLVVVLNIMEEAKGRDAEFDVDAIQRRLSCPVMAVVATRRKQVEALKAELLRLVRERPRPGFTMGYPPLIEEAVSELTYSIREASGTERFDDRWLAVRLLEGDAFATRQAGDAVREVQGNQARRIVQETGDETDILIADSRYRFIHTLAGEALPKRAAAGLSVSARIDGVVLNRLLGIPIFLGVMYGLFWFTIQLSRAFKPFVNQLSDTLFVEGPRQLLGSVHTPAWLTALLADGVGNGMLQVVNFIPIIGFLYLFISVLEESGYMARASFVMDRLMQALGLPGNAFVPMVLGFGCNVPAIMATRTLDRPRDRAVAVLMSPFMSCGGRLAVYTVFAAAFYPEQGHLVIFGIYLIGIVFAMITSLFMKHGLLPEERSVHVLELPSYHWPKPRNVLINAWIRVKGFVFRVGKFIIPMVLVLKVLSAWGTDGSFNQQPIDHSLLAATGRTITPVLAPMGVREDQWPATVALLTGVLHKVVIVSTLESIYLEEHAAAAEPGFDLVERLKRAALTVPQNLKALVGLGQPVLLHKFHSGLAPALASRFDGQVGALAYLILVLCYPCIATTAATAREINRRWTGLMVFWTISLGYGVAVLFYQIGTFLLHPYSSTAWIVGVVTYFMLLGVASAYLGMRARHAPVAKV
jgi:ferrous iron transport protein B